MGDFVPYKPWAKGPELSEYTYSNDPWIGHPACESAGESEEFLISRRTQIVVHWEHDWSEDYSYSMSAIVECGGKWASVSTKGCSCPSPVETWAVEFIADSVSELIQKMRSFAATRKHSWEWDKENEAVLEAAAGLLQ